MLISPLYIPHCHTHIKVTSHNYFYIAAMPHHIFDAVQGSVNVLRILFDQKDLKGALKGMHQKVQRTMLPYSAASSEIFAIKAR